MGSAKEFKEKIGAIISLAFGAFILYYFGKFFSAVPNGALGEYLCYTGAVALVGIALFIVKSL